MEIIIYLHTRIVQYTPWIIICKVIGIIPGTQACNKCWGDAGEESLFIHTNWPKVDSIFGLEYEEYHEEKKSKKEIRKENIEKNKKKENGFFKKLFKK